MSKTAKAKFKIDRRQVQIGAKAQDGRVAAGFSIGETYAVEVMTPAKLEKIAAQFLALSNALRGVAATARKQKRGFFRRFLPW
jgi:hypothetical protein